MKVGLELDGTMALQVDGPSGYQRSLVGSLHCHVVAIIQRVKISPRGMTKLGYILATVDSADLQLKLSDLVRQGLGRQLDFQGTFTHLGSSPFYYCFSSLRLAMGSRSPYIPKGGKLHILCAHTFGESLWKT